MRMDFKKLRQLVDNVTVQSLLSDLSHVVALERLGPKISERVAWRAVTDDRKIALTFDDGPEPTYTPKILKVLQKHDVPATFFLIGKNVNNHFTLAEELVQSGHEIGNHTYSHAPMFRLNDDDMTAEIKRTHTLLLKLNGDKQPRFLRPPMGLFSPRVLNIVQRNGYKAVVGDVYPRDAHCPGKERIVHRILKRVTKGSIIILHDGGNSNHVDRSQTVWAIDCLIPLLKERGYQFLRLSDLLKIHDHR